jgi:hypothetical protein
MKYKILIICFILIVIQANGQLFDIVNRELDKAATPGTAGNSGNMGNTVVNLLQTSEKVKEQSQLNSVFNNVNQLMPQQPQTVAKESSIRVIEDEPKKTEIAGGNAATPDIEQLKKDVQVLLQTNEKLVRRFEKANAKSRKVEKGGANMYSFIQEYDKDMKNLKDSVEDGKHKIQSAINEKDVEFKKLYNQATSKFNEVHKRVEAVNKKIEGLQTHQEGEQDLKAANINVQNLSADNASFNRFNATEITLPSMKITKDEIVINGGTKIVIDGEAINVAELVKDVGRFQEFVEKCGKDFERCKPVSEEVLDEQKKTQEVILNSLRDLRAQTNKILMSRRDRLH